MPMTGPEITSAPATTKILTTIILVFLLASSMLPLYTNAGTKTTTLSGGKSEDTLNFPPGGGTGQVSLTLPYGAVMSNASIGLEGLPSIATGSVNQSKSYDFGPGTFDHTVLNGDHIELAVRDHWWDDTFHFRFEVQFNSTDKVRKDIVVTLHINMTVLLKAYGLNKDLDKDSIRVVEHNDAGLFVLVNNSLLNNEAYLVPHRMTTAPGYDQSTNANITIDWTAIGNTPVNTIRYYSIYFDTMDHWKLTSNYILKFFDDAVISNIASPKGYASVFLSDWTGPHTTSDYKLYVTDRYAGTPAIADLNRDGYMDIIVPDKGTATGAQVNSTIYYGAYNGYTAKTVNITTIGASAVKAGDLNGDGWPDLVFAYLAKAGDYTVDSALFYGSASGFKYNPDFRFDTTGASDVEILDYNADGRPDVAFASMTDGVSVDIQSTIFVQNATGGFKVQPTYKVNTHDCVDVATGDLNGDGIADLTFANYRNDANNYDIDSVVYYGNKTALQGPGLIKGHGATGIALADVDSDGTTDIVMSNSGPPGNTSSYIYYNNISGVYQVPTLKLPTDNASAVAFGDTSGDGKVDLAFAQASSPGSVSKVYVWCCSGFTDTSRKLLPSEGAVSVVLGDVDRYHMDLDSDPPTLTHGAMEGRIFPTGNFTSKAIGPGDRVLSAVGTWSSAAPPASSVHVFLSNDGGVTWNETQNTDGLVFQTEGSTLMYRVQLSGKTDTPRFNWMNLTYAVGGYPSDVSVDIGADGMVDWLMSGTFNYSFKWNTSALRAELNLQTSPDRFYPWENITVPIEITSNASGMVRVFGINLTHNSPPYLKTPLPAVSFNVGGQALAAFDLDGHFADMDNDTLTYTVQGNSSVYVRINSGNTVDFWSKPGWSGTEHLTFVARDPDGGIVMVQMTVTVNHINLAPKAVINRAPKTGISSLTNVTFDGSNSTDPDGKIIQYIWSFDDGTYGVGPVVTHAFKKPNKAYSVALTVIDDGGLQATAQVAVQVDNLVPVPKISVVDNTGTGFDTNTNIGIDMSGTMDKDGTISSFVLDCGDGYVLRSDGAPPTTWDHMYKDGTYTYTLTLQVTDDLGLSATARTSVKINNVGPIIIAVNAPGTASMDQKIEFTVSAKDPDGIISKYMWDFEGTGDYKWTNSTTGNATYKYPKVGTYHASLKVIDDDGKASFQTVIVKVTPPPANESLGFALVFGVIALALGCIVIYYILHQRSIIVRQRDLLVKRDETLRALQKELSGEAAEEDRVTLAAPVLATKGSQQEDEEDLGTLEAIESEGPKAAPVPKEEPRAAPTTTMPPQPSWPGPNPIFAETSKPIFAPAESTGIMPKEPTPPPKPMAPKGLPDMMGAAQSVTMTPPPKEEPVKETPRPEPPKVEPPIAVPPKEELVEEEEEAPEEPKKPVETRKVLAKARCPGCKALIPLYSLDRPMRIKCESCGKEGVIK